VYKSTSACSFLIYFVIYLCIRVYLHVRICDNHEYMIKYIILKRINKIGDD